jgi:Amt family ammonium transporter
VLTSLDDELPPDAVTRYELTCLRKPVRQSSWFDTFLTLAHRKHSLRVAGNKNGATSQNKTIRSLVGDKQRLHVLVADDNEINQLVASEMLRAAGYDATVVNNGREAVSAIRSGRFDVVLMDCEMPELDGFAATRMIRTMEADQPFVASAGRPLPVIALTAQAVQGDRERCLSAGMTDYVTKPVNREELLRTIQSCLDHVADEPSPTVGATTGTSLHVTTESPTEDVMVLDVDELNERCLGDRGFIDELLRTFIKSARDSAAQLSESITDGRIDVVAHVAHELKGSAGNVSAGRLSQAVAELETAARTGRSADYDELGERVFHELEKCEQTIELMLSRAGV